MSFSSQSAYKNLVSPFVRTNRGLTPKISASHRYILEPYRGPATRHRCPSCEKPRKFSRYIDTDTREHLADQVGRCDREDNCGYHYKPRDYFEDTGAKKVSYTSPKPPTQSQRIDYIPSSIFEKSLSHYDHNNLTKHLRILFGNGITRELIKKFHIGTSKHWPGATVFWQIDNSGKVRGGKVMLYNPETGCRIKDKITWAHSVLAEDFTLQQCLFGEHQIKDTILPIAIVESEKTAIIASVHMPNLCWLATGGKQNLRPKELHPLKGHAIVLFPDLGAFDKWSKVAQQLEDSGFNIKVSDFLETRATEAQKEAGLDLADFLTQLQFEKPEHSQKLMRLIKKNPKLQKLMERLELVEAAC